MKKNEHKVKFDDYGELWHGDCLVLMQEIGKQSIDMVFADLPYGTTKCKWDVLISFDILWKRLLRCTESSAVLVFTACQPFTTDLIQSQRSLFRYCLVWEKQIASGFLDANRKPLKSHEDIVVFSKKGYGTYNPQGLKIINRSQNRSTVGNHIGKTKNSKYIAKQGNYPKSVLRFNNVSQRKIVHDTQKPVSLLSYLIRTYSNPGDLVLDPTCGSGTTACACINTGRKFICIEKDSKIFDIAKKRINSHIKKHKASFGFVCE